MTISPACTEFVLKCQNNPKIGRPINKILGMKRFFFDFRGMILVLLATRKSKFNALIDIVLR